MVIAVDIKLMKLYGKNFNLFKLKFIYFINQVSHITQSSHQRLLQLQVHRTFSWLLQMVKQHEEFLY